MAIKAVIFDADGVVINSPGYFSVQYEKELGVSNDIMLPFFKGIFQEAVVGKADLKEILKPVLSDWGWKGSVDELLKWWFKAEHYVDDRIVKEIQRLQKKESNAAWGQNRKNTERNIFEKIWVSVTCSTNHISLAIWVAKNPRKNFSESSKTISRRNIPSRRIR